MSSVFGETRTFVGTRHALIAPDGHVPSTLPGFDGATPYYMISATMGAGLTQLQIVFEKGGSAAIPEDDRERFFYVEEGAVSATGRTFQTKLESGGYLYLPTGESVRIESSVGATLTCFEKIYQPISCHPRPEVLSGNAGEIQGEPFLENEKALLQVLLPTELGWDMAVNIFTYEPGATLPFVETHIMEHGLLMVAGQGIYRLEDKYYPVKKGDVIWMAPYCPQWFVAMGDEPASYLYYKNVNRAE